MVAADARTAVNFCLTPCNDGDAPAGRRLLQTTEISAQHALMDRAYEGDETWQLILDLVMTPVVPSKRNCLTPWEYDCEMYKKRNEVERLFRQLKGFRRIFSRFDKLDVVFTFFIHFALIFDALNSVNTPWYERVALGCRNMTVLPAI